MSEPTEAGLGPAEDDDVEQATDYQQQRAVDEAMAVYSTDDELVEHEFGDALEEEKYGEGDPPQQNLHEDPADDPPDGAHHRTDRTDRTDRGR